MTLSTIVILLLIIVAIFDLKSLKIPIALNCAILILVSINSWINNSNLLQILIRIFVGFLFLFFIRLLTKGGMGLGDAILSASVSVLLGIWNWLFAITSASIIAILYLITLKVVLNFEIKKLKIPFAPFMTIGAIILFLLNGR